MDKRSLGIHLILWGLVCLMPIPLAALFPVKICSFIYIVLWVVCAIIFTRIFTIISHTEGVNTFWTHIGASFLIVFYLLKAVDLTLQLKLFGNLDVWNFMGISCLFFGWVGLVILFYNLKMGLTGIFFLISGVAMTIPSLLSWSSSICITEWDRFSFLVPISSLIYLVGFATSIVLCIVWIRKDKNE